MSVNRTSEPKRLKMNNEGVRRSWQPSDQPDRRLPGLTNQDSASDDQIRVHAPPQPPSPQIHQKEDDL